MRLKKTVTQKEVDEFLEQLEKQTKSELAHFGLTPELEQEIVGLMSPKLRDKYKNRKAKSEQFATALAGWLEKNRSYKFKRLKPTVKIDSIGPIPIPEKFVDHLIDRTIKFLDRASKPLFDSNIKQVKTCVTGRELQITVVTEEDDQTTLYLSLHPPFRLTRAQTEGFTNFFNNRP